MTHKPDAVEREMDFEPKRAWGEDLICSRCNEIIFENGAYVKAQDKIFCHVCVLDQAKINQKQLATTTAELKELREFVGAMWNVGIGELVGCKTLRGDSFYFHNGDYKIIVTGTDPFDAWQKL